MKRTAILLCLSVLMVSTGCVATDDAETTTETEITEETEQTEESEESELSSQIVVMELADPASPETVEVTFEAQFGGDLESFVEIEDLLNVNVTHSQVPGRIGSPIQITYSHVEDGVLTFVYDPDELRGISEENIIMLRYNGLTYDTMEDAVLDTDENTVSLTLEKWGVYLLVDSIQWNNRDGVATGDYDSNWESERDTGSIVELADTEWADANAPEFHVSTAEELASVVYYVNAAEDPHPYYTIELEADIDLSGYEWEPMGWISADTECPFSGCINGNGHTITGMHIEVDRVDAGFVGYGLDVEMNDITFADAYVSSTGCVGIAGGQVYGASSWTNVTVTGRVYGDYDDYGSIVGRQVGSDFEDCTVDCIVNDEEFPYYCYSEYYEANTEVEEVFTLTLNDDYTVTRDEHSGFTTLTWHIEVDGEVVLLRYAEDELTLPTAPQWFHGGYGTYTIWLVAAQDGQYIRVSNIVEYERIP